MAKISVTVPAHNCEKYITRCLDSIAAQIFGVFECIIVDGGSSDNTHPRYI